jgi:NADP-dependent 3-hydroxy acid dehydrogenase YdfG
MTSAPTSNRRDGSTPARTVLITGASSGIGRLTAELMASRGWQVAATARDPLALSAWAAAAGPRVATFRLDVTDEARIADAVALLPDALWRSLMAAGMTRRPRRKRA